MKPKNNHVLVQGVLMKILGSGVLLTGPSGIGKSDLALGLIHLGHKLVADDCVEFHLNPHDNTLVGHCPAALQNLLEVRGLGILNVVSVFGKQAMTKNVTLALIIQLTQLSSSEFHSLNRLTSIQSEKNILNRAVPELSIPIGPNRNMPLLVETAVRYFQSQTLNNRNEITDLYSDMTLSN